MVWKRFLYGLVLISLFSRPPVFCQSTIWNSSLTLDPNPSSFLSEWQREIRIGTFTLTYNGTAPVQFYSKLILTHSSLGQLISAKSKAQEFLSGPITQIYAGPDIVDWQDVDFNVSVQTTILRTGRLPEGIYDLRVEIHLKSGTLVTESSGYFNIVYPDAPQLILPQDQTTITTELPVFQWNPVITPPGMNVNYRLRIVERLQGQNLNQAMMANVAHCETTIVNQGYYNYPNDALPFENGKEYVWQITAINDDGNPITSNDGKSELWSFNYFPPTIVTQYPFQNIIIIANRAFFSDISGLTIIEDQTSYRMSGNTTLKILLPGGSEFEKDLNITNWVFTKTTPNRPPDVTTGDFTIDADENSFPASFTGDYFKPKQIRFSASQGMVMTGTLQLPNIPGAVQLMGEVEITQSGFNGDLSALGQQLYTFEENNIRAVLNSVNVEFRPSSVPVIKFGGSINLFNNNVSNEISNLQLDPSGTLTGNISFNPATVFNPVPGQQVTLTINAITGGYRFELPQNSFDYTINLNGVLSLPFANQTVYTSNFVLDLNKSSGLTLTSATGPNTPLEINVDFFKMMVTVPRLTQLNYAAGLWDFKVTFNGQPVIPALGNLTLPPINDLVLENSGLLFQPYNTGNLPANTPGKKLLVSGLEFDFKQVDIPQFGLNWIILSGGTATGLNLGINFELNFPNFPEGTAPELKNIRLPITGILKSSSFTAEIPISNFPGSGYKIPLSENINFFAKEISGTVSGTTAGNILNIQPRLKTKGALTLPSSFNCSSGMSIVNIESLIDISAEGRLSGSAENISVPCQLQVGQYTGSLSTSRMVFGEMGQAQKVDIYSNTSLALTGSTPLEAAIAYDLIAGDITSLSASISSPFQLNFPKSNPVLPFTINSAELTKSGLAVNGRNSLKLGSTGSIGCTFNNILMPLSENAISNGDIILDNAVSMKVNIIPEGLVYSVLPINSQLAAGENSALMIDLPADITINRNGFKIIGESTGRLKYSGYDLPVVVQITDGCTFSLDPFKVTSGSIKLIYNNLEIGSVGVQGFMFNQSNMAFSTLPENLTLPSQSIAFLKIKEENTFLVNYASNDSGMHIWTSPGQTVKMILPIFKFNNTSSPELNVSVDFYYDLGLGDLKSGTISAAIPQTPDSLFDLTKYGLPYVVNSISYGTFEGSNQFKLTGNLKLFNEPLQSSPVEIYLRDGILTGAVSLNSVNKIIPLVPGSQKLILTMNSLTGGFNANLIQGDKTHEISINSKLDIPMAANEVYSAAGVIKVSNSGTLVEEFIPQSPSGDYYFAFRNFNLSVSNIVFDSLNYKIESGWNFRISFTGQFRIPSFGLEVPAVENFVITKQFFSFPAIALANLELPAVSYRGTTLKPMNIRYSGIRFNWFDANQNPEILDTTSLGFDFELQLTGLPARFPPQLASAKSYISGARYSSGKMSGLISNNDFIDSLTVTLPSGASIYLKGIQGSFNDSLLSVRLPGSIVLPDTFKCENNNGIINTQFNVTSSGLKGTTGNVTAECPIKLGPGTLNITGATIDYEISEAVSKLIIDARGNLLLPPPTGSNNVSVAAAIKLDVLDLKITEGQININKPFKWEMPSQNPVFNFKIENALINKDGFKITGTNGLTTGATTLVPVTFNDLMLDMVTGQPQNGSIKINEDIAFKILLSGGTSSWSVAGANSVLNDSSAIRLNIPANSVITKDGLPVRTQTVSSIKYQGSTFDSLTTFFSTDFVIDINPVAIKSGSARFMKGTDTVGTLTGTGFVPANLLKKPNLPVKIVFNGESVAYLELKNNDSALVTVTETQNGYRLNSVAGKTSKLVVPSLKYNAGTNPEFPVTVTNVLVDKSFERIIDGSIQVLGNAQQPLISLKASGVPLKITKIRITRAQNNYNIIASGLIDVPGSIQALNARFDSLVIGQGGITGNYQTGTYSPTYSANAAEISSAVLGTMMSMSLTGLTAQLNPAANTIDVRFSGDLRTNFFRDTLRAKDPFHYTAIWNSENRKFNLEIDNAPNDTLKIGKAKFKPIAIGNSPKLILQLAESMAEISISGELIVPALQDFRISIADLKIYNDRVAIPLVTTAVPYPSFRMFNCKFEYSRISFQYDTSNTLLAMTTAGTLTFLNNVKPFTDLIIGGDGKIYGTPPAIINSTQYLVGKIVAFNSAVIQSEELIVEGFIKFLGASPVDTMKRYITFKINRQGVASARTDHLYIYNSFAGFAQISPGENNTLDMIVFNRPSLTSLTNMVDTNRCRRWVWKFLVDPIYMGIKLDFNDAGNSYLQTVMDIWAKDSINAVKIIPRKLARIGSNTNNITPGITVYNTGNPVIGPITYFFGDTLTVTWKAFYLKFTSLGFGIAKNGDDWKVQVSVSGSMGIGQPKDSLKFRGSLSFNGLTISNDYEDLANLPNSLTGGTFVIAKVVDINLSNIRLGLSPTTLFVKGGEQGNLKAIDVNWFFRFTAHVSVKDSLGTGGVDSLFIYSAGEDRIGIIVQNLTFSIKNKVNLKVDFEFITDDTGFKFLIAGNAKIVNRINVTVVGKISTLNNKLSLGLFVAASGLAINISGNLYLTGLGGGFFYNPDPTDKGKVLNKLSMVGDPQSRVNSANADFMVLVYAELTVTAGPPPTGIDDPKNLVRGQVLLCVTNAYLTLDGKVTILRQENKIYGNFNFAVGWSDFFVDGNIDVIIKVPKLLDGTAKVRFFVYLSDSWGIIGAINGKMMETLEVKADLFVGPQGFLLRGSIYQNINIKIIAISAGLDVKLWYIKDVSWGVHARAFIEASVLGGIIWVKGQLEAALLGEPEFYIYGVAELSATVLFIGNWTGSVWAKISADGIDGGTGRDSEMDKLIAEATETANRMVEAKNTATNTLNAQQAAQFTLTEQQIAEAFQSMFTMATKLKSPIESDREEAQVTIAILEIAGKLTHIPYAKTGEQSGNYNTLANNCVQFVIDSFYLAVPANKKADIAQKNADLNKKITDFNNQNRTVSGSINGILSEQLNTFTGSTFAGTTDPFSNLNIDTNSLVASTVSGAGGMNYKNVSSTPAFTLDLTTADANKNKLVEAQQNIAAYEQNLITRITDIESRLNSIKQALTSAQSGYRSVGANYKLTLESFENYYAVYLASIKSDADWAGWKFFSNVFRNSASTFFSSSTFESDFNRYFDSDAGFKRRTIEAAAGSYNGTVLFSNDSPGQKEMKMNNYWNYINNVSDKNILRNEWKDKFYSLWFDILHKGFITMQDTARIKIHDQINDYKNRIVQLENTQESLSASVDSLFNINIRLTETLYDLYNNYGYWKVNRPDSIKTKPISLATINAKKDTLRNNMKVPQITALSVGVNPKYQYDSLVISWTANHPTGIIDNAIKLVRTGQIFNGKTQSVGISSSLIRKVVPYSALSPADWNTPVQENATLYVKTRGGAGYSNTRYVEVTMNFKPFHFSNLFYPPDPGNATSGSLPPDNTQPVIPKLTGLSGVSADFTVGGKTFKKYAVSKGDGLTFEYTANDPESGIIEYQYAIHKAAAGNNSYTVVPCVSYGNPPYLYPKNEFPIVVDWTSTGGRTRETINTLSLQNNLWHFVRVRAKNGSNLWSNDLFIPIFVDSTQPNPVGGMSATSSLKQYGNIFRPYIKVTSFTRATSAYGISKYFIRVVSEGNSYDATEWKEYDSTFFNKEIVIESEIFQRRKPYRVEFMSENKLGILGNPAGYFITTAHSTAQLANYNVVIEPTVPSLLRIKFTNHPTNHPPNNQTQIAGYKIFLRKTGASSDIFQTFIEIDPTQLPASIDVNLSGTVIPDGAYRIDMSALSKDSVWSVRSYRGDKYIDQTPPSKPIFTASAVTGTNKIKFNFTSISRDDESGIKGYRVAVGNSAGDSSIVGWSHPNITFGDISTGEQTLDFTLQEISGKRYYSVRAINNNGLVSQAHSYGPIEIDRTPPLTNAGSLQWVSNQNFPGQAFGVKCILSNVEDLESGINKIYVVWYKNNSSKKTETKTYNYVKKVSPDPSIYWSISRQSDYIKSGDRVKLELTIYNKVGLEKKITVEKTK